MRGIFTKYSVPEMFPDRTILELLAPSAFVEGIKEAGIKDLHEFEAACLMRVLAKPELDDAVILNELVMIMENFGVPDQLDDEEDDDYIPDTEQSVALSDADAKKLELAEKEQEQEQAEAKSREKPAEGKAGARKSKKRVHNLANIDAKGIKILTKLARYLLKQYLHPREFFGKSIQKEHVKTKKREF